MPLKIERYTIAAGAETPFSAYHMTDNHLCLADSRDDDRKNSLAERRERSFAGGSGSSTEERTRELFEAVKEKNALLLHTGDLIDFVSEKNLEFARSRFDGVDAVMCAGNHEFSLYVGEAWEDEAYKAQSLDRVAAVMPEGMIFGTKEVNGVRFITLFNGYYYILPELLAKTEAALSDGVPCVLLVHTPLYSEDTYEKVMRGKPEDEPPYLCGCPDGLLEKLSEHRFKQQRADKTTLDFIRLCNSSKNLKAVLTGHIHASLVSKLDGGVPQIAPDAAYNGVMNEYYFV